MKRIHIIVLFLFISLSSWGHPWKPSHYVIVDSDGGIDDLKAICMLLASPDVRLLAITTTDGYHSESEAFDIIKSMLDSFHHEGVPVVHPDKACELINYEINNESSPVSFLALGSLKTAAKAINTIPDFRKKIKEIIWTNDCLDFTSGFNYKTDPLSAEKVLSDSIPLSLVGCGGEDFYNNDEITSIAGINTRYAEMVKKIIDSHSDHKFVFTAYDEMVPLLLHYPQLFEKSVSSNHTVFAPKDIQALRNASGKILSGATVKKMQVLKEIPADTSYFMPDIQPAVADIINKYGEDEWTSGVIANELHRHLGVFAIIGVKMGIRAREYFATGVDEFQVTSNAGSTPPLSCMNDGLQVSTGATPGHGLLTVPDQGPFTPSADFTYKGTTIRLTLKKGLADKVTSELKEINFVYGLDSNIYWELVRKNTIKYWQQFDRNEIFDIRIIKSTVISN